MRRDDTQVVLGPLGHLDVSLHSFFRIRHSLGRRGCAVFDVARAGAGDPGLAADVAGVRGRGGDRVGSGKRSVEDASCHRQLHRQPAASRRPRLADDLFRRSRVPPQVHRGETRPGALGRDLRPVASSDLLHLHLVQRDALHLGRHPSFGLLLHLSMDPLEDPAEGSG